MALALLMPATPLNLHSSQLTNLLPPLLLVFCWQISAPLKSRTLSQWPRLTAPNAATAGEILSQLIGILEAHVCALQHCAGRASNLLHLCD